MHKHVSTMIELLMLQTFLDFELVQGSDQEKLKAGWWFKDHTIFVVLSQKLLKDAGR